jgi:hypothetical protein
MKLWSDQLVTESVSLPTAHTHSDGIMDHKPVLVSWNQANKLRQLVIKLRDFLKARRGNNNTVVNSSHRSSHRTRHPVSTVRPILRPSMSNLFRTTSRNYWQQNLSFISWVFAPSAMYAVLKTARTLML